MIGIPADWDCAFEALFGRFDTVVPNYADVLKPTVDSRA